nr:CheR family methyltransferase [Methylomagnum ishizawai]
MLRFQSSGRGIASAHQPDDGQRNLFSSARNTSSNAWRSPSCRIITASQRPGKPIRIWVVPSSSGEEPYSIAIYLLEYWAGINDWDVEIISSDIDTRILGLARAGLYSPRSVLQLPEPLLKKYFTPTGDHYQHFRRSAAGGRIHPGESQRTGGYPALPRFRCGLLPQPLDLFRRTIAQGRRRNPLRRA